MKLYLSVFLFFIVAAGYAQDITSNYKEKKVALRDTVVLDSAGINPKRFVILDREGNSPDPFSYRIDFKKGTIIFSEELQQQNDSLTIQYLQYPEFLTREYFALDPKIIVENTGQIEKLYSLDESNTKNTFTPFEATLSPILFEYIDVPFLLKSPSNPCPTASCNITPGQP